ncbi:retinol dehydrogenase 16-like isoform X3 [Colius striatus]|uniref:retinol dehydrogenase 16-like isoform X3 n=1 Tax=Colius striatus TaxID=57412 RepID=UPI002B1D455B|nr:retinol dehydrogenase 16-like isoform X3 [Colius striatus]
MDKGKVAMCFRHQLNVVNSNGSGSLHSHHREQAAQTWLKHLAQRKPRTTVAEGGEQPGACSAERLSAPEITITVMTFSSKELQQLSKQYSNVKLLQLDVVCENSIKKVVKEVEEIVGDKGLNCLINNAGINVLASLEEVTAETMLTIYETNTVAQLMVTKAFLPLLRKAAQLSTGMGCHRAAIINMSSLAASMQLVQANEMFLKVYPYRIAKNRLTTASSLL